MVTQPNVAPATQGAGQGRRTGLQARYLGAIERHRRAGAVLDGVRAGAAYAHVLAAVQRRRSAIEQQLDAAVAGVEKVPGTAVVGIVLDLDLQFAFQRDIGNRGGRSLRRGVGLTSGGHGEDRRGGSRQQSPAQ